MNYAKLAAHKLIYEADIEIQPLFSFKNNLEHNCKTDGKILINACKLNNCRIKINIYLPDLVILKILYEDDEYLSMVREGCREQQSLLM